MASPIPLPMLSPRDILLFRPAALVNLISTRIKLPVIVKTHNANTQVGAIGLIPQDLTRKSVYLIRDPRDVAISYSHHMGVDLDKAIDIMADENHVTLSPEGVPDVRMSWSSHVSSWEKIAPVFRYEDLLSDPVGQFSKILEEYEIPVDADLVAESVRDVSVDRLAAQERSEGFIERENGEFFTRGGGSRWKSEMTAEQAQRIEDSHRDVMEKYGYADTEAVGRAVDGTNASPDPDGQEVAA